MQNKYLNAVCCMLNYNNHTEDKGLDQMHINIYIYLCYATYH